MKRTRARRIALASLGIVAAVTMAFVAYCVFRPLSATERRLVGDWRVHRSNQSPAYCERYTGNRRFFIRNEGDADFDGMFDISWSVSGDTIIYRTRFDANMWWSLFTGALKHGYLRAPGEFARQRVEFVSDDELYFFPDPDDESNYQRLIRIDETTLPLNEPATGASAQ